MLMRPDYGRLGWPDEELEFFLGQLACHVQWETCSQHQVGLKPFCLGSSNSFAFSSPLLEPQGHTAMSGLNLSP